MSHPKKERLPCPVCQTPVENLEAITCSHKCQQERSYQDYISRWKRGLETGNKGVGEEQLCGRIRRYLREKYQEKCARCGWSERNPFNGIIHLTTEHIDGNWANTTEENLTLLCPNCHSLTPTYGVLNKGKGRPSRHRNGALAQLGEHHNGIVGVVGSSPICSTTSRVVFPSPARSLP